jgi:3-isopropylmalate dehydrogenase
MVTENLFGDILTDEAGMLSGSLGMLPSASIGLKHALFDTHSSAPILQPQEKILPTQLAMILFCFYDVEPLGLGEEGMHVRRAVETALGRRSGDRRPYP